VPNKFISACHGSSTFARLIVICAASSICAAQTTDHDRLEAALSDIALLKRVVSEQNRRIADLEKQVRTLSSGSAAVEYGSEALPPRQSTQTSQPWKTPSAWDRIRNGISQSQVTDILGRPTSVSDVGPYRTMFYRGHVPGSGSVTGTVELNEDRVWPVNKPVFSRLTLNLTLV
jgi:hypothetical protein